MHQRECTTCHTLKPENEENFILQRDGQYRKQCRACKNDGNRAIRAARAKTLAKPLTPYVDPHMRQMVGAALRMWGGPVNRDAVLRWAA